MNEKVIREKLSKYDDKHVSIYISYLNNLRDEKDRNNQNKNAWFKFAKDEDLIQAFVSVANKGIFIDGETVTLTNRGKIVVTFDYHAYKNMVLAKYPNSKFDASVVYMGDDFNFWKESGKVFYKHNINNPFDNNKVIVGAYCILKNERGEFIELLNMDTITKMKNTSKMKNIWDSWFDRMVLKSALKRVCTIHFKDITNEIDKIDNESNDPELANIDDKVQEDVNNALDINQLNMVFKRHEKLVSDRSALIKLCAAKRKELEGGNNE